MKPIDPRLTPIREAAEADLAKFIQLLAPHRLLGAVHYELIGWWERSDAKSHQLVLLPRGHQKSAMIAYRVAWEITRNPAVTILYVSATSDLAEKQLKMIQDILTSPKYMQYWPEMVNPSEGKREKWNNTEISVDHPKRKEEGVRDPTVFARGLTSTITGLHCDVAVLDDVVVQENAYTDEGREKVAATYSLLSSIENPGAKEWTVGTRYHPKDLYSNLLAMEEAIYDSEGAIIEEVPVYEVFERVVEDRGDGTGEFLWPAMTRKDGKQFGFNTQILAKKKAQYLDRTQFRAQYYNDPNDPESASIKREWFQYYDRKHVNIQGGTVFFQDRPLSVVAAIDFAFSKNKKADYTALVVIGMDHTGAIYVLDIVHFRSDQIKDYYEAIRDTHKKWGYRKLRVEVSVAQQVIVRELTSQYLRPAGLPIAIDEHRPTRHQGSKEERLKAVLQPRYSNLSVFHYQGGNCQTLEEELVLDHPPHDDIKDALANAIEIAKVPLGGLRFGSTNRSGLGASTLVGHGRFGGYSR